MDTPPAVDTLADRYSRMSHSWWLAAVVLLVLPIRVIVVGLNREPPPADEFTLMLRASQCITAAFLIGSLVLYRSYRLRLPPVTRRRWWGPAENAGRRVGFWVLWTILALNALFLGLMGERLNTIVLAANPAAYLHPDATQFAIETLPTDTGDGLIHFTLRNDGNYRVPLRGGQVLGELQVETPAGPYLLGEAQLHFPVRMSDGEVATHPLPDAVAPHSTITFLIPFSHWGSIRGHLPTNLNVHVSYVPTPGLLHYQPIDLFERPLREITTM